NRVDSLNRPEIIDLQTPERFAGVVERLELKIDAAVLADSKYAALLEDMRDPRTWQIYKFTSLPEGFLVIPQIFHSQSSERWFQKVLCDIPSRCAKDLKSNITLPPSGAPDDSNLRWVTFGYHHNWDTKHYDKSAPGTVPDEISLLLRFLADLLYLDFAVEA